MNISCRSFNILSFLLLLLFICSGCSFNKERFIQECGLNICEMTLTEDDEINLVNSSCPILTFGPSLESNRQLFVNNRTVELCRQISAGYASTLSLDNTHYADSLLRRHYCAYGLSLSENIKDVLTFVLDYATNAEPETKYQIGNKSYKWAKKINDTLALRSVYRIIESIESQNPDSNKSAKEIVSWCKKGLRYQQIAAPESPAIMGKLAKYGLIAGDRKAKVYFEKYLELESSYSEESGDDKWARLTRSMISSMEESYLVFKDPLLHWYYDAISRKDLVFAKQLLESCYGKAMTNVSDNPYTLLKDVISKRIIDFEEWGNANPRNSSFESGLLSQLGTIRGSVNLYETVSSSELLEYARIAYLNGSENYSSYLNQLFYSIANNIFPTSIFADLDNFLSAINKYPAEAIDMMTYQYNNIDPVAVYDAALFIKGTSNEIPSLLFSFIKDNFDPSVVAYCDSIRTGIGKGYKGYSRETIEKQVSPLLTTVLSSCLVSYGDVLNAISDDEVAIEFIKCPSFDLSNNCEYKAVIATKDYNYPVVVNLGNEKVLYKLFQGGQLYSTNAAYDFIIEPISNYLKGKDVVYFSTDGLINMINFQALLLPSGERLVNACDFKQLSSTRELVSRAKANNSLSVVLYGGLLYDIKETNDILENELSLYSPAGISSRHKIKTEPKYLPFSKAEVDSIEIIATQNGYQCKMYSEYNGTEDSFKKLSGTDAAIVHLATHGFYYSSSEFDGMMNISQRNPLDKCGLFFSCEVTNEDRNSYNDGIIWGSDIARMDFSNVDMAILSACQTAVGDFTPEGITGLCRALKLSGANTILVTLSDVDDQATSFFMKEFYKRVMAGGTKSESYRKAVSSMTNSKRFSDPRYWAPFLLIDG